MIANEGGLGTNKECASTKYTTSDTKEEETGVNQLKTKNRDTQSKNLKRIWANCQTSGNRWGKMK